MPLVELVRPENQQHQEVYTAFEKARQDLNEVRWSRGFYLVEAMDTGYQVNQSENRRPGLLKQMPSVIICKQQSHFARNCPMKAKTTTGGTEAMGPSTRTLAPPLRSYWSRAVGSGSGCSARGTPVFTVSKFSSACAKKKNFRGTGVGLR